MAGQNVFRTIVAALAKHKDLQLVLSVCNDLVYTSATRQSRIYRGLVRRTSVHA